MYGVIALILLAFGGLLVGERTRQGADSVSPRIVPAFVGIVLLLIAVGVVFLLFLVAREIVSDPLR